NNGNKCHLSDCRTTGQRRERSSNSQHPYSYEPSSQENRGPRPCGDASPGAYVGTLECAPHAKENRRDDRRPCDNSDHSSGFESLGELSIHRSPLERNESGQSLWPLHMMCIIWLRTKYDCYNSESSSIFR